MDNAIAEKIWEEREGSELSVSYIVIALYGCCLVLAAFLLSQIHIFFAISSLFLCAFLHFERKRKEGEMGSASPPDTSRKMYMGNELVRK